MFKEHIKVRFCETDALRHVSNTALAGWFESAREPIFKLFLPSLDVTQWPLILARYSIDFKAQLYYGTEVEVRTEVARIGNSSFELRQQIWQSDTLCAEGMCTMVHFDHTSQRSEPIPEAIKARLCEHLLTSE